MEANLSSNLRVKKALKVLFYYLIFTCFSLVLLPGLIIYFYPTHGNAIAVRSSTPVADKNATAAMLPMVDPTTAVAIKPSAAKIIRSDLLVDFIIVYRHKTGQTEKIPFEEYIKGVVASEMPSNFEMEALKAQAVAARTYSLSKIIRSGDGGNPSHTTAPICDGTHCQVYRNKQDLESINGSEWMKTGWPRIEEAVENTVGRIMFYQGELVEQAMFHSTSGGKTANSEDVFVAAIPYLRSVESPLEEGSPHYMTRYGHGVGMSQWGANGMASAGDDYKKILSHYYTGIEFK